MIKVKITIALLFGMAHLNAQTNSFPNDGNVGIGNTSPSGKLEILKNADLSTSITLPNSGLVIRADNDGYDASLRLGVDNTNLKALIQTQQTTSATKFDLLINPFGGDVGIGTTSPEQRLDVNGKIQADHLIRVNAATPTEGGEIGLDGPSGYNDWRIDNRVGHFRLHHSGTVHFQLNSNGSLGLGTTSTGSHKLAVEGSVGAREVKVEASGWSDYVFEDDYNLPTLEEVEKHIIEKGHLINIPSAKEVEENGIQLGEMNKLLLEKVEELTLYTLQQQKELKNQKELNQKLEKRLLKLENKLNHEKKPYN